MASEGCSSTTSAVDSTEKQEIMKKAGELLAQGKRNVVCGEVPKAISLFDEAVQMLAKEYGDLSRNCADAYFSYGSALLELGRMETNVLGVALEGVDVEAKEDEAESDQFEKPPEEGEEREKLRTEVYDAMAEGDREEQMKASQDKQESHLDKTSENKKTETVSEGKETSKGEVRESLKEKDANVKEPEKESVHEGGDASKILECKSDHAKKDKESEHKEELSSDKKESEHKKEEVSLDKESEHKKEEVSLDKESEHKKEEVSSDKESEHKKEAVSSDKMELDHAEKEESSAKISIEDKTNNSGDDDDDDDNGRSDKVENKSGDKKTDTVEKSGEAGNEADKDNGGESKTKESPMKVSGTIDEPDSQKEKVKEDKEKENVNDKEKESKGDSDIEMADSKDDKEGEEDGENDEAAEGEEEAGEEQEGEEGQEGTESQEEGEEKDEDVPNFQLAWEYLDLAKVIYLKSDVKEEQLKAAECHIKLGEVSMETEQHGTAAEDLQCALKIQQKFLSPEDRVIAETHYQLGLAYGLGKEFELSIQHYQQAISVIEAKIASLNKLVEGNEVDAANKENKEKDDLQKYKDEIKELQELIPEMKNKIEDTRTEAKDMEKMKEMAKEMLGLSGTSKGFGSPTKKIDIGGAKGDVDENGEKKATDISSMVRKKRKPEEETSADATKEVKKIKQDDGTAADASGAAEIKATETKANGSANKVDEPAEVKVNGDASEAEMATDAETGAAATASS